MTLRPELLDELLKDYQNPEDILGETGILKQLTKALIERCLNAELDTHLQEEKAERAEAPPETSGPKNRRNGHSKKTIKSEFGQTPLSVPRDRNGEFEPVLVPKGQSRFNGFDDKILSLYARGMTTRDIQDQLQELYGVEVSPALTSTPSVTLEVNAGEWQNRTLDSVYPIV
jgi:putative transposase